MDCPLCAFVTADADELQAHAEGHFAEAERGGRAFIGKAPQAAPAAAERRGGDHDGAAGPWDLCGVCGVPVPARRLKDHVGEHFAGAGPAESSRAGFGGAGASSRGEAGGGGEGAGGGRGSAPCRGDGRARRRGCPVCGHLVDDGSREEHEICRAAQALADSTRSAHRCERRELHQMSRTCLGSGADSGEAGYDEQRRSQLSMKSDKGRAILGTFQEELPKKNLQEARDSPNQAESYPHRPSASPRRCSTQLLDILAGIIEDSDGSRPQRTLDTKFVAAQLQSEPRRDITYLSHSATLHCASDLGDKGWGCGYRNAQMLISCLAAISSRWASLLHRHSAVTQEFAQQVSAMPDMPRGATGPGELPGVPKLQEWIEEAWVGGFDLAGARQLNNKLVRTRKWIGPTELYATFSSRYVPVNITDFGNKPGDRRNAVDRLISWAVRYFRGELSESGVDRSADSGSSSVKRTGLPPLYVQYQGHSWTIVGVHVDPCDESGTYLVAFDPGRHLPAWARSSAPPAEPQQDMNRSRTSRTPRSLPASFVIPRATLTKHREYQILWCGARPGTVLSEKERAKRKVIASDVA